MDSDDDLVLRCRSDPDAFRGLVERYKARLYSFLIRLAGREAADDLFQEVWIKVYDAADRYEARGKAASWLFKIANNLAINHVTRSARAVHVPVEEAAERLRDPSPQPHAALERDELRRRLSEGIDGLPREQRAVFMLREYAGLSFKEIAETLEIPLGTALSRMNYAMDKLRNALGDAAYGS